MRADSFPWHEHELLLKQANDAILRQGTPVTGGWTDKSKATGIYRGGEFEHAGERWVACSGKQRPSYARLLDATSCFMSIKNVAKAVAFLDPALGYELPSQGYHERFVSAAWHGLGIVWAPATHDLMKPGVNLDPLPAIDADFAGEIRRVVVGSAKSEWLEAKSSRVAEALVRPVLDQMLQDRGYLDCSRQFASYWRNGVTDGAWQNDRGTPRRIALEVKVNEDADAPFGQIVDDLGEFDAVVHVRILNDERTRRRLFNTPGLEGTRARFSSLPVITITLRACAVCKVSIEFIGEPYPYLVCETCDQRALARNGESPAIDPAADRGENPVFIDSLQCWRRYRFGGWITMADPAGTESLERYYEKHMEH